ncbi:MAG: tRNA 2-thiouridine(34) synthase MnmA [Candidatus Methylumidiphilus alinenensis]|uniref:tRNA-specific 2-thiouridylase MnmA n=1 Tax=Candidatus Methylumidiphilus alinenensis TaxID=2202197 RepID=A0A2W4R6D6_9GAMM|nr:MAG: tRNA 2-thiouridine(34) synthase MnmA [Candidatus Methylumidiphilus alinenensis]
MSQRVIVGMSGGVDSSVTALVLLEQGYEVSGLFMKNWDEDDGTEFCTAKEDLSDAQAVCDRLGIPLNTVNFSAEYWDHVFEIFLREYAAGRTPNPDILCNKEIKFKAFLDYAQDLGGELIATGHYARVDELGGRYRLLKGLDGNKDQSYFIYTLGQPQLSRTLFPIGGMEKPKVREIASKAGFDNARKRDSTGICFIGERRFKEFLQRYLPARPGEIQTTEGEIVGSHEGLMYYTLGQRRGFGIGGVKGADQEAWYVLQKDLLHNVLIVGQGHDHPWLFTNSLEAGTLDWCDNHPLLEPLRCTAKTRYRQPDQACRVEPLDNDRCKVVFDEPQRAVTPGQSVVFYQGEECLGGGVIESTMWSN